MASSTTKRYMNRGALITIMYRYILGLNYVGIVSFSLLFHPFYDAVIYFLFDTNINNTLSSPVISQIFL